MLPEQKTYCAKCSAQKPIDSYAQCELCRIHQRKADKKRAKPKDTIKGFEDAVNALTSDFVNKYYDGDARHSFWVADEIGGLFFIGDENYDLNRILEALKYNATFEQLMDFSEIELKASENRVSPEINFRNFVKYGGERYGYK